jgi:amidase/6-aminohexanoate-cyclic-dimer hydrolase
MGGFSEFDQFDALGLAELVRRKDVTPEELLDESIDRVERLNPQLNAVTHKHYDEARKQIADGLPDGPFVGVPYLLKDLHLLLEGTATTSSSKLFEGNIADHDSTLVERYKAAGLVLFGKTNTPEFGLTMTTEPAMYGPCRNPWNTDHSTGGSSGGAGAVVAARINPMANASDGGGSIRIPAAACGVFGMKPTRARNPSGPDRGEGWNGCSVSHAVSLTVRDNAALLDATEGAAPGDLYAAPHRTRPFLQEVSADPGRLKIAFSTRTPAGTPLDADCALAVKKTAKLLEDLGHDVVEAWPDYDPAAIGQSLVTFIAAHCTTGLLLRAEALGRELTADDVEAQTWAFAEMSKMISSTDYARAQIAQQTESRKIGAFFDSYDAFIQPTLGMPPAPLGWLDMNNADMTDYITRVGEYSPFTSLYNITGNPSMSVPLHWTETGLPVGTMITGAFGDEATLFRLAGQLEKAEPWIDKKPPLIG